MIKCSSQYIYILISLLSIDISIADDNNMGGLYIGLGANVGYDEYDARANVGQSGAYGVTVQNTANSKEVTIENGDSANNLVTKLWECGKTGEPQDIKYNDTADDPEVTIVSSKDMENYEEVNVYAGDNDSGTYCIDDIDKIYAKDPPNNYTKIGKTFNDFKFDSEVPHFHDQGCKYSGIDSIKNTSAEEYFYKKYPSGSNKTFDQQEYTQVQFAKLIKIFKSDITLDKATYLMSQSLHRSGHNAGGEMKMAYFHDFGNHIMAGLDLTGAVLSKNRRDIQVSKFNVNPNLILKSNGAEIAKATYVNNEYQTNTIGDNPQIAANLPLTLSADLDSIKASGMQVVDNSTAETYIDVSNNDKEVSFEKGIFNPKLAFVVGGTYKGWFAGLRAGVSYNTGKVKTQEMTETKSVSIASPLVGVQVMKKVSNNTNLYMTADWNVGDLRKSVDINGIKSFKQSSYNISAGVQWKCSFLK